MKYTTTLIACFLLTSCQYSVKHEYVPDHQGSLDEYKFSDNLITETRSAEERALFGADDSDDLIIVLTKDGLLLIGEDGKKFDDGNVFPRGTKLLDLIQILTIEGSHCRKVSNGSGGSRWYPSPPCPYRH